VHTILATQRPSHEVIDGTMKNNFAITIGFRVKNAQSSGVVMDDMSNKSLMYIDPEKPGRCIMRGAKRDLMLQIPLIESDYARELLSQYSIPPQKVEIIDMPNLKKSTDRTQQIINENKVSEREYLWQNKKTTNIKNKQSNKRKFNN
jgi:hypothetical protein